MPISDWPVTERPRERLLAHGAERLSDAELLAILLRTGCKGSSALDLARTLLGEFGSLQSMLHSPPRRLQAARGLGQAKAAQLAAALELARRSLAERMTERSVLSSPAAVSDYLRLRLGGRPHEVFAAIFLDAQHRVIAIEELFRGTLTQTSVYPREVAKCALDHNAAAVILAHNHPSGLAEPSRADELLTRTLKAALAMIDVQLLDHFIVTASASMSFAERGLV